MHMLCMLYTMIFEFDSFSRLSLNSQNKLIVDVYVSQILSKT